MPLSWNEIRDRAIAFSREWADAESEDADAKSFWDHFFNVFGVSRRRVATFERRVKKIDGKDGYIDLLWKGMLLIEHKSRGKDLNRAHQQARDYFHGLTDSELPRYLVVSDFARFRLYDLEGEEEPSEFALKDLHKQIRRFGFIAGYQPRAFQDEAAVNVEAAERMGKLHDALRASGYEGHPLEVLLVRLLFCLFADDTGIFPRHAFHEILTQRTSQDGADLGGWLAQVFQVLDTPPERRQKTLDEQLAELPYVNGRLFAEPLPFAAFNATMRELLIEASALDWGEISPAIFGSMFQSVMNPVERRSLGAHYTSEKNILKLIGPLFLDDLKADLERAGANEKALATLHSRIAKMKFLDPACGCGNFLVIAYRELRLIELEILNRLYAKQSSLLAQVKDHVVVDVDQFFGIEIEEFPAQIAQAAMWLVDHQMNSLVAERFGEYFARLPLTKSAVIVHGNALRLDWNAVVPASEVSYVLGNPPFSGAMVMSDHARADFAYVFSDLNGAKVLDFVAAWYWLGAKYMRGGSLEIGFVSTNSICQGEQVGLLWRPMIDRYGVKINFAHRTFRWTNEARGAAAVHCVIVGFGKNDRATKQIFDYDTPDGEPLTKAARRINPYLVDAPIMLLENRSTPICQSPGMRFGSMPRDGGNLLFTQTEFEEFLADEPGARPLLRPYVGADEYISGSWRWCLWLLDADPALIRSLPKVVERIERVRQFRLASKAPSTRGFASTPGLFCQIAQPDSDYLLIPAITTQRRHYVPLGFMSQDIIANNKLYVVPGANLYHLGVLSSDMHMAWMRFTCGRMKSDFSYSKDIVYNNFPWPIDATEAHRDRIANSAQGVLDARAQFPDSTLADLYDPNTMPPALVDAHRALDRTVDAAYVPSGGKRTWSSDADRVSFLFEMYQRLTSLLPPEQPAGKAKRRRASK